MLSFARMPPGRSYRVGVVALRLTGQRATREERYFFVIAPLPGQSQCPEWRHWLLIAETARTVLVV